MKKLVAVAVVSLAMVAGTANAEEATTTPSEAGISPVKIEMRLLNDAFLNLIDSLVLNTPDLIEEPFHKVHMAKANTEKALEKGEIKLPKNGDKIKQFVELDEQFHKKLEVLIEAAGKKDMKEIQEVTHKLLNACVQCHSKFRN